MKQIKVERVYNENKRIQNVIYVDVEDDFELKSGSVVPVYYHEQYKMYTTEKTNNYIGQLEKHRDEYSMTLSIELSEISGYTKRIDLNTLDKGQLFWNVARQIIFMSDEEIAENDIPYEIALILKYHYKDVV
jgi:hypothetical protein